MSQETSTDDNPDFNFDWSWTEDAAGWVPPASDPTRVSVARIYDYLLGGKDHFAIDRLAGDRLLAITPDAGTLAKANRAFLVRAVRCMAEELGIRQFIDLGTGIPSSPSVHQTARAIHPDARVVYIDHDPMVLAHNRALLTADPHVLTLGHDFRRASAVLTDPAVRRVIDFNEPVGLLFVAVLHFVSLDLAPDVMDLYQRAVAPGSALAITVASREGMTSTRMRETEAVYGQSDSRLAFRSRAQIEQLFEGFDLIEPGLADMTQWREPDGVIGSARVLAGVGEKRRSQKG